MSQLSINNHGMARCCQATIRAYGGIEQSGITLRCSSCQTEVVLADRIWWVKGHNGMDAHASTFRGSARLDNKLVWKNKDDDGQRQQP